MEETQSSGTTAEEIDLLDLMKKIWARRIFVLKAAGIGVWGLSNWESSLFHVAEEQCDILQQLDGKLVSGFVKLRKPHKEIYEAALNQFGIKADGALFIDDKAMNIVGSNAAGIRGVRFQDPVKLRELLIANGVNIPAVQ